MNFRPLHGRVLLRRIDAEEKSAGGIISGYGKREAVAGEIIAVGLAAVTTPAS